MGPRRGAAGVELAAVLLAVVAASCTAMSPIPRVTGGPSASPSPSTGPPAPSGVAALPAALFGGPAGLAISARGRPDERSPIRLPPGHWRATAALGPGATVLLVSAPGIWPAIALVGRLMDGTVAPLWHVPLPTADGSAVPGCLGGERDATVIADDLLVLGPDGVRARRDVPGTVGRCQMDGAETVLYLREDDHAVVAWSLIDGTVRPSATTCDDLALARPRLACLAAGGGTVTIGRLGDPTTAGALLVAAVAIPVPGTASQVLLTPDADRVLAVAGAQVAIYGRGPADAFAPAGAFTLPDDLTLLGFVEP